MCPKIRNTPVHEYTYEQPVQKNVRVSSQENCIYFLGHENTVIAFFFFKKTKLEVNITQVVDIHIILLKHPKHMHNFESFSFSLETYCGGN